MTKTSQALIWAAIIIAAALIASAMDLSNAASFGIVTGLSGAAWGAIESEAGCGRGCVQ